MTPEIFYREIRDQIKHEDNLCNNRMTWLIALQGFLFTAYGFSISAEAGTNGDQIKQTIAITHAALVLLGTSSAIVIAAALFAAVWSIHRLVDRWYDSYTIEVTKEFPQIIGSYSSEKRRGTRLGQVPLYVIPGICCLVWLYIQYGDTARGYFAAVAATIIVCGCCIYAGMFIEKRKSK